MAKFKIEIALLLTSIVLFSISAFCFSYASGESLVFPSRNYAFPFIGFGGALLMLASISYAKRSKNSI